MANDDLLRDVESIRSLVDAMSWAKSRTPPAAFVDAIAQDEFTHDVVLRVADDAFVVLDTT
jgi:hypothetical protein